MRKPGSDGGAREQPPKLRPRRRRRLILLGCALGVVVAVAALVTAVSCRPSWYDPPAVSPAQLRDDKVQLSRVEGAVSAALNTEQVLRLQLREDQINRWLAAGPRLWPETALGRYGVSQPQITIDTGSVRLAARVQRGRWKGIAAVTCRPELTGDEVVLTYEAVRIGALPVGRDWLDRLMTHIPASLGVRNAAPGTLSLPREWVWPNGKRRFRICALILTPGLAEIVLEPLPREQPAGG